MEFQGDPAGMEDFEPIADASFMESDVELPLPTLQEIQSFVGVASSIGQVVFTGWNLIARARYQQALHEAQRSEQFSQGGLLAAQLAEKYLGPHT